MYICNCMGITEREVRGAIDLGATTVAELSGDLGLGTCCGKCVPEASAILRSACHRQVVPVAAIGQSPVSGSASRARGGD